MIFAPDRDPRLLRPVINNARDFEEGCSALIVIPEMFRFLLCRRISVGATQSLDPLNLEAFICFHTLGNSKSISIMACGQYSFALSRTNLQFVL